MPKFSPFLVVTIVLCGTLTGCSAEARKARLLARAERDFNAGDYDKAKVDYLGVLRNDPENRVAIQRMGLIWSEQGAGLRALPFLLKTRELAPGDISSRLKLATVLLTIGESSEAKREALGILQQAPGTGEALRIVVEAARQPKEITEAEQVLDGYPEKESADYHVAVATLALRKGDAAAADNEVRRGLAADPKSSVAHMVSAYLASARQEMDRAKEEYRASAELAPLRSSARLKYAEFLFATGAPDEAKKTLTDITRKARNYLPAWRLLAQIAAAQKDYKTALANLENVFSRDPEDLDGRILESNILLARGEASKATAMLEKLDSAYKGRVPAVKLQIARSAMAAGNRAAAEAALSEALAANPDYAEAIVALGQLKLQAGDAASAIKSMTELLKKRPDLSEPRLVLAAAYQAAGRAEPAIAVIREQLHFWPKDLRARLLLANILRQQNKIAEAREELFTAAQVAPKQIAILAKIIELDLAEKNPTAALQRVHDRIQAEPRSGALQYLEAKVYFAQQNYAAAEAALQKALALDPNLIETYELLVAVYLATNRVPDAIKQAETVTSKNPKNVQAFITLALLRERMNDYPGAAAAYEKVIEAKPTFVPALNNLAYLYAERLNQGQKAVELARRARVTQPNDAAVADTLGWALFKQKDYSQALPLVQEAADKLTDNSEVQFHLGMVRYMMGQPDGAKAAFQQALNGTADFPSRGEAQSRLTLIETGHEQQGDSRETLEKQLTDQPGDIVGWIRVGEMYEAEKNIAKAAEAYEHARKLNPNLVTANLKLAQLNAGPLENKKRALELAKKARDLAPNDAAVAATLGGIVLHAGNYQWAYSLLQETTRQKSNDPVVLYDFAWAAYYLGKVSEAREAMQKAQSLLEQESQQRKDADQFLALTNIENSPARVAEIEPQIEPALQSRPDYLPALVARGAAQAAHGDSAAAIGTYADILRQYPDFAPAQRELAALYSLSADSLDKAKELATRAHKSLPDDARLTRLLAEISFRRKDYRYAIQLFEESALKQPLDAALLYQLGVSELETSKTAAGVKHLRDALAAGLDSKLGAEAQRRISAAQPGPQ